MSEMIDKLNQAIDDLKSDLGEGLITTDIWHSREGQSIAGYNSQPKAVALVNELTLVVGKTLKQSEYPGLGNYYLAHLENDLLLVVITLGEYQQGLLVDLSKTTMGVLMSVSLPKLLNNLKEAMS